jgi:F0F1-type ATP synthase membrane subunit b/b'
MWLDPVVEEVRKRRQELMAEYDYDPKKILQAIKKEEEKHADRLVSLNKKPKKAYKRKSTISKSIDSSE